MEAPRRTSPGVYWERRGDSPKRYQSCVLRAGGVGLSGRMREVASHLQWVLEWSPGAVRRWSRRV